VAGVSRGDNSNMGGGKPAAIVGQVSAPGLMDDTVVLHANVSANAQWARG
jgi:hypothetical protein